MKRVRFLALAFFVLLLVAALVSCGENGGDPGATGVDSASGETTGDADSAVPASEGLAFLTNGDGTCTVTGIGTCKDKQIVIPSKAENGDRVTSIAVEAFKKVTSVTGVIIPGSVSNIGDYAFNGCSGLTSVTVGNGVTRIGKGAF